MPMFLKHGEKPASRLPSLLLPGELAPRESMEQLFIPDQVGDEGISELCVQRTAAASLNFFYFSTCLSRILQATPVTLPSLC